MKLNRYKTKNMSKARRLLLVALIMFFAAGAIGAIVVLINTEQEYNDAQNEYHELQKLSPFSFDSDPSPEAIAEATKNLMNINSDYIGWVKLDGTVIDYPVVRGVDNEQYIKMMFTGEEKKSGTIFMDWKCKNEFNSTLGILYGHNLKDGNMFASLQKYREKDYLYDHPIIKIITKDGVKLSYRIFAVKVTDITDNLFSLWDKDINEVKGYFSPYDKSENIEHFLVLSTCVTGGGDNDRLLIFAGLE